MNPMRIVDKIEKKHIIMITLSVVLIAFLLWAVPRMYVQKKLSELDLEEVSKIVYVEYEEKPLSSPVKVKKYCSLEQDHQLVEKFLSLFDNGKIKIGKRDLETSKMMFFYIDDDTVVNAYVTGETLGFQYGKYWIKIDDVDSVISSMEPFENVSVENL